LLLKFIRYLVPSNSIKLLFRYLVSVIQLGALLTIYNLVQFVEEIYKKKSW
jgi:hypothetical protein